MKHKRIKTYLKFGILLFGISVIVIACQKDDNVSTEQNSESKTPKIETISYDDANTTFSNLKAQYNLDRYKVSKFSENVQAKSTTDTLGLIIETDIIKQATLGDYTSYTMKIVHQNDSTVFYNLTIEYKNGESAMFITKYTPTEYWLNNKGEVYQGEVQSKRATLTQYTDPEEAFEEELGGGLGNPDLGSGPGGGGGSYFPEYSPYYPSNCNGIVLVSYEDVPFPCGCGDWDIADCNGCPPENGFPMWPGVNQIPMYYCQQNLDPGDYDPYDPGDTGNPGGGSLPDPTEDDPSITVTIKPEECTERITGDLDGDCTLDAYELCLLNGNNQEVCDCVANGNELLDCLEPKTDCESLSLLVANDSLGSNILPVVNQLRTKLGADENEWSISYENVWSEDGIREGTSRTRSKAKTGNTWVGQIHTHPEETYAVFSWLDLKALRDYYIESNDAFNDEIFLMAVTPNNVTYALRISDIQTLIDKIDEDWTSAEGVDDEAKELFIEQVMVEKYSKSTNQEQAFLELYGNYGISFYKATDANLTNWKLLELDENNNQTVNETPCN